MKTSTLARVLLLATVVSVPAAFYGCGEDDPATPGPTADASVDSTKPDSTGGGGDSSPGTDGSGGDSATEAATDAAEDVFVIPSMPCQVLAVVDAGDAGDAGDADAGPTYDPAAAHQVFTGGMAGCAGKVRYVNRATLCNAAAGCTPCTAAEWIANNGGTAPTHQYWVDESLRYTGDEWYCRATLSDGGDTDSCGANPMRVCMDGDGGIMSYERSSTDINGNNCNWTHCDYGDELDAGFVADATAADASVPNLHFGGCLNNLTAGSLCCCK